MSYEYYEQETMGDYIDDVNKFFDGDDSWGELERWDEPEDHTGVFDVADGLVDNDQPDGEWLERELKNGLFKSGPDWIAPRPRGLFS